VTRTGSFTAILILALLAGRPAADAGARDTRRAPQATPPFVGVWRVASSQGPGARHVDPARPSLFIFTPRHYSLIMETTAEPRPGFPLTPDTTAEQFISMFGQAFQAQAGTYVVAGESLVLTPIVAKNPVLMTEGHQQTYAWTMRGEALQLSGPGTQTPTVYLLRRAE
jgi:hypothetical protein